PTTLVSEVEVFGMYGAERQGFTEFKFGIALGAALVDAPCRQGGQIGNWTFVQQVNNDSTFVLETEEAVQVQFADWPLDHAYPFAGISLEPNLNQATWIPAIYSPQTTQITGVLLDSPHVGVQTTHDPPINIVDITMSNSFRTTMLYVPPG